MTLLLLSSVTLNCRFFSEDGNFSQDEASRYFKELKKLEGTLLKKVQLLQKQVNVKSTKVKTTLQQKSSALENM